MKKIIVASGKGGVGKTTVAVNIAKSLSKLGLRVGILDVDIDTPNLPEMMNIEERDLKLSEDGITPKIVDNIEVMSIGFMAETGLAIMWNGDRRAMAIDQMFNHVDWTCDILVIDTPPGTGEELITVIEKFKPDGIIIVTTNHKASIADVKRTLTMIDRLKSKDKVIGIVKNMTYIICDNCESCVYLFKSESDKYIDELTISELPYLIEDSQTSIDNFNTQFSLITNKLMDVV